MVNRSHTKETPSSPRGFKNSHLNRHRTGFNDIDAADQWEQEMCISGHCQQSQSGADTEGSNVTHKYFRRSGVPPQEAATRSSKSSGQNSQVQRVYGAGIQHTVNLWISERPVTNHCER